MKASWKVKEHRERTVKIEYTLDTKPDVVYLTKIENINLGIKEELLRTAIEVAVKSHYRRHRFTDLTGEVSLAVIGTDDDKDEEEEGGDKDGNDNSARVDTV